MHKAIKEGVGGGVRSTLSKLAVAAWVVSSEGTYKTVTLPSGQLAEQLCPIGQQDERASPEILQRWQRRVNRHQGG